jgi:hypothetical protein
VQKSSWRAFEEIPGLTAFAEAWQNRMGGDFPALAGLCLDPAEWFATSFPCPDRCGCSHHVIPRHDGEGAIAVCRCHPPACPDIPLSRSQITPLQLNWTKLARALCQTFGLTSKFVRLPPPNTVQIGAWSVDAVPAVLTIQVFPALFRGAVAELTSILRQPFILFAPTSTLLDAPCQAMLENHRAAFFALDSHLLITGQAALRPRRTPGELFARFTPQPKASDEDLSRRVFALVSRFDAQTLAVFRRYCIEGLSALETAGRCDCSKTTVLRRLNNIRAQTGVDPKHLRTLSPHLAKIEADLADWRATHIDRKSVI